MIVWGGHSADELGSYLVDSGYQYDPAARTWTETNDTNAPTPRFRHTAVWTGREMIVWGGSDYRASLKSGALYDPAQDIWSLLPEPAILAGRQGHTAVWTGSEMIVWGGVQDGTYFNDGARYNPITHSWRPMTSVGTPIARAFHTAVWTGTEMIVWGGEASDVTNTGARYDPVADQWTPVSLQNAPLARKEHTAVWTGSEMVIWGGSGGCCWTVLQDGARYNPITNRWTTITTDGAPQARMSHTAVWTGQELVIWGGLGEGGVYVLQSGASYSPIADRWLTFTESGAPNKRVNHSVIWTGREMIVWGGSAGGRPLATGGHWHVAWLRYFPIVVNSN